MALGWVINLFERAGSATGRINEFLHQPPEPGVPGAESREAGVPGMEDGTPRRRSGMESRGEGEETPGDAEAGDARGPGGAFLAVRDLSFSYDGEGRGEALRGVSLEIGRGEVVGLVGLTGCGKSTLLSLILRFHPAPPGTIFLEGRDIGEIPLDGLRRSVAWVGQDPFLFSDTVLSNIGYGLPEPDAIAARRAAGHARILSEIEEMPEGFLTVIGERGISLSGGQKQRATLARALCAGGELLLLDDALSSVDSETEREIFDELLSARAGRTVLFSTHRMASLSRCDRILVMDGGRIAEQGTHDELLSRRRVYFDLYSRQMLSRELEDAP